ncbi:quinolinate synthase NadA [Maridesulfovibrio hydrothermalis]|uniref:Quinolinate synthase n=1 Tax=Maridesulfovibrio hydrothermalis AM13 = DSM 14728 TaxID=1121451 RepID=L0REB3_9BACT|nr:quinolinate synthase NadA [Maridesulfovibrio hydrothermalis]CCO24547.1 quinolinate synthetase [Maridesulfovibrio hydrothermalis AM13 = DSM 14728]
MYSDIIADQKKKYGNRLAILGHHYQSDEIIRHTDLKGDSLELARQIEKLEAEYIVFCGVHFMAESAAIVRRKNQKVYIPDASAGCVMANMAPAYLVDKVLTKIIKESGRKIIPLAYVNTPAAVKTVCGKHGGSVCTSANAEKMLSWALEQGDGVLFLPDKNLALNTADKLGIPDEKRMILNIRAQGDQIDVQQTLDKKLLIWPGLCAIHQRFKLSQVESFRAKYPGCKVVVHPECPPELVEAADGDGSTSYLIKYVADSPAGSTIIIGTETNLVNRLKNEFPDKNIIPLRISVCSNMAKINEKNLAELLQNLETASFEDVSDEIREPARIALERMLQVCA